MQLARNANIPLTSSRVRKTFLDFFCADKGHKRIRSSPVVPYGDPSLAFVNAGMNQFKGVLLGASQPPACRVANSQKCVRVGGKHNDLAEVGTDGTHHTFFEMLGNWSFGDYYKEEACEMSWELLTSVYGLDPSLLHVTYFGGDESMRLQPDLETRDIWLKLGVPPERIEPRGAKDNFWEMGESGPCGACTEIHYLPTMLELWNLVFIQYKRELDGSLEELKCRHVDTGMGLERLVAVLQGKNSNYDTDLFSPIFSAISLETKRLEYSGSWNDLDTAYRILADHTRMFTVCLADGMLPDQEYDFFSEAFMRGKLRGIIRRALTVARTVFNKEEQLLTDLSSVVAETLGDAYPELPQNLNKIKYILNHEAELLRSLRDKRLTEWHVLCQEEPKLVELSVNECPNLIPAYRKLKTTLAGNESTLDASLAWKLCETYGVPSHLAGQLANVLGLEFDFAALEMEITRSKLESRKNFEPKLSGNNLSAEVIQELHDSQIPETDDRSKYAYAASIDHVPTFLNQTANIVAILINGDLVDFASHDLLAVPDIEIGLILDRTNLYSEAGGQESDTGTISVNGSLTLKVNEVFSSAGFLVHNVTPVKLSNTGLRVNQECLVEIDEGRRTALMNNHTATHILNAALRTIFPVVEQRSSRVTAEKLCFDFSIYGESLTTDALKLIEQVVNNVIRHGVAVKRRSVASNELPMVDCLTVLPGETYHHEKVHVIEINSGYFLSREPCCGTHAVHTSHLEDFVIVGSKSLSSSVKSIRAVTGPNAVLAKTNEGKFSNQLKDLNQECENFFRGSNQEVVDMLDNKLVQFLSDVKSTEFLGYLARETISSYVDELRTKLKYSARGVLRTSMEAEMKEELEKNTRPYLVHYLLCSSVLDKVPLQKASRICGNLPSMLFAVDGELIKARCCVPMEKVTHKFSAELWMKCVMNELKASGSPPKGQNPQLVFNMKGKKISQNQLQAAMNVAREFFEKMQQS